METSSALPLNASSSADPEERSSNMTFAGGEESDFDLVGFLLDGVTLTLISLFGVVANLIALIVLLRPKMRSSFHTLLVALSVFDILYLLNSQMIFGFPGLSEYYEREVYPLVLPVCYGLAHTGRVGSVYLTMSVTIER